jgi:hypothetical protein
MAPLTVDPAALDGAGSAVITVGEGLAAAIRGLGAALAGSSGMAGDDPAGAEVGRGYDSSAFKVIEAMVTTRNGLSRLGDGVRMSAHNYSLAEAHSDLSGRGNPLPAPPVTAPVSAGSPPSSVGTGTNAPPGWGWVAPYIGMIWPTADSAKMRVAAAAWLTAGTNFGGADMQGTGAVPELIRAQQIPEGGMIDAALTDAYESTTRVLGACQKIADQLNAYADKVEVVHAAILDLLARICNPLTGIKEVWEFLTGDDEDEIKKIARDIRTVVDNFTAEVQALGREIGRVLTDAENVVATMGKHAAKEWDQFLHGTEVGRELNQVGQLFKGVGEEAWDFGADNLRYGLPRAVVDPPGFYQDWGQRLEGMAPLVGLGGDGAPSAGQAWKDFGKGIVHWDEWSKNPAEAAGKSLFDVVSAVVGGKGMSETGKALRVPHDVTPPGVHTDANLHPTGNAAKPETTPPPGGKPGPAPGSTELKPGGAESGPSGKPEPAPPGSAAPHSPAEPKPPMTGKPGAGEPPKVPGESAPSKPGEAASRPPADAAPAREQHPESENAPASPHRSPSSAPHPSRPESALMHAGELLKSPIDGGPPSATPTVRPPETPQAAGAPQAPADGDGQSGPHSPVGEAQDPVHSDAHSGDGWHRVDDKAGDPTYGEPLGEHWPITSYPDLDQIDPRVRDLIRDPDAPYGRDPAGHPFTKEQYEERYNKVGPNGEQWHNYPPNDGAVRRGRVAYTSIDAFLRDYGRSLDRLGDSGGKYLAVMRDALAESFESRSLPVASLMEPYNEFRLSGYLPDGWSVEVSEVATGFGRDGGSLQVLVRNSNNVIMTIQQMDEAGMFVE